MTSPRIGRSRLHRPAGWSRQPGRWFSAADCYKYRRAGEGSRNRAPRIHLRFIAAFVTPRQPCLLPRHSPHASDVPVDSQPEIDRQRPPTRARFRSRSRRGNASRLARPLMCGFFLSTGSHGIHWEVQVRRGRPQSSRCARRRARISTSSHRRGVTARRNNVVVRHCNGAQQARRPDRDRPRDLGTGAGPSRDGTDKVASLSRGRALIGAPVRRVGSVRRAGTQLGARSPGPMR